MLVSPSRVNAIQFMYFDKHSRAPDMAVGRRDEEGGEACDMEVSWRGVHSGLQVSGSGASGNL